MDVSENNFRCRTYVLDTILLMIACSICLACANIHAVKGDVAPTREMLRNKLQWREELFKGRVRRIRRRSA